MITETQVRYAIEKALNEPPKNPDYAWDVWSPALGVFLVRARELTNEVVVVRIEGFA